MTEDAPGMTEDVARMTVPGVRTVTVLTVYGINRTGL